MFDATLSLLERSLDLRMKAHEVHVSNLANANVTNFKARRVDFEERLQAALGEAPLDETRVTTEEVLKRAVEQVVPQIYEDPLAAPSGNGNTVSAEREQVAIAKNTVAYEASLQLLNKKFALQKYVLSEGGR
jgi:flagellar basal-body rod protein FlgB